LTASAGSTWRLRAPQVLVAHIENGKITEVWNSIASGETAWNEFWG
jgi:hypothetical protein